MGDSVTVSEPGQGESPAVCQGSSGGSGSRPVLSGPWVTFCPGSLCMWVSCQLGWLYRPLATCGFLWPQVAPQEVSHLETAWELPKALSSSFSACPGQPRGGLSTSPQADPWMTQSQMNERTLEPKATEAPSSHSVTSGETTWSALLERPNHKP